MNRSQVIFSQKTRVIELAIVKLLIIKDKALMRVYRTWIKLHFLLMTGVLGLGVKSPFANIGVFLKQAQILALALSASTNGELQQFLKVMLIYNYKFYENSSEHFSVFCASLSIFLLACLIILFFQVFMKKCFIRLALISIINLLTFVINNFLIIPIYLSTFQWLKSSENSQVLGVGGVYISFIFMLILFIHLIIANSILYDSFYDSSHFKSRSHSLTVIKQDIGVFLICMIYINFSDTYFLVSSLLVQLFLAKCLIFNSGYYKRYQVIIESGFWVVASTNTTFHILNLHFPLKINPLLTLFLLAPLEYIIVGNYIQKQSESELIQEYSNPYSLEMDVRKLVYNKKDLNDETLQQVEKIFNEGTKQFYEFKLLYIWEFNFIVQYKQDITLALIKISKSLFSEKRPKNLIRPLEIFSYLFTFECEFLIYSLTKIAKKLETSLKSANIKYQDKISAYKVLDFKACCTLISIFECICLSESTPINTTLEKFKKFFKINGKRLDFYEKFTKNYGFDRKFIELFDGFKSEVFRTKEKKQDLTMSSVKFNFLDKFSFGCEFNSQIILGGSPQKISVILHTNEYFKSLLKYPNENIMIGLKLAKLIPGAFWKPSKNLTKFILFSKSTEFFKDKLFFFNFFGYLVEVSAKFQAVFIKNSCQFIVSIAESPCKGFVLTEKNGKIISKSEIFQSIMMKSATNIEDYLPGLLEILEFRQNNQEYSYDTLKYIFHITWELIEGSKSELYIIYIRKEDKVLSRNSLAIIQSIQDQRRKSIYFGEAFFEEKGDLEKSIIIQKREEKKQKNKLWSEQDGFKDQSDKIEKGIKLLRFSIFGSVFLQVLIYFGIIVFFRHFYQDSRHTGALKDVCGFRYQFSVIILNLRAIDLLNKGVKMNFGFTDYNQSLYESVENSTVVLNKIQEYRNEFNIKDFFIDREVISYNYFNSSLKPSTESLYNSIIRLLEATRNVITNNYQNESTIQGIYKNGFYHLQHQINVSTYETYKSIKMNSENILLPLQILNTLSLLPFFLISILSFLALIKLRQTNKSLWNEISRKPLYVYSILKNSLIERIKRLHDPNFTQEPELNEKIKLSSSISRKFYLKFSFFWIISILYFIVFFFVVQKNLNEFINLKLDFRFYGGLRTASVRPYMWAREVELHKMHKGYLDFNTDYIEVSSEENMAISYLDNLHSLLQYTLNIGGRLYKEHGYSELIRFILKNSCVFLSEYEWCDNSALNHGVYTTIETFIRDLEFCINSDEENFEVLNEIEQNLKYLELSLSKNVELFSNFEKSIEKSKRLYESVTGIMIIFLIFYTGFVIFGEIRNIEHDLAGRNEFLSFFENAEILTSVGRNKRVSRFR